MDGQDTPELTPVGLTDQARKILEGHQRPSPLDEYKAKPPKPAGKPAKGRKVSGAKRGG